VWFIIKEFIFPNFLFTRYKIYILSRPERKNREEILNIRRFINLDVRKFKRLENRNKENLAKVRILRSEVVMLVPWLSINQPEGAWCDTTSEGLRQIYFVRTRLSILVYKLIIILYSTPLAYLLARNSSSRRWRKSFQGWAMAANQIQPMSYGTLHFHPPIGLCQKSFEILSWRSAVNSVCFTDIKTNSNLLPRGPWINCQLQAT